MPLKEPPPPPDVPRGFRLHVHQWIGLPLIALLPLLSAFGFFGPQMMVQRGVAPGLSVSVEYPAKLLYGTHDRLRVQVTNSGVTQIDTVLITIDTAYLSRFKELSMLPDPRDSYGIELTSLDPSETREATIGMKGDRYGEHRGTIKVASGTDTISSIISTYVYW